MPSVDLDLMPALARAVDEDTLVVHFQPEVDLASGGVVGMEALVRWQHPQRGLLWPVDFLAVADRAGLLPMLGWEVLRRSAKELASWKSLPPLADGSPRQLWVNVSASQLLEADFAERIAGLIAEFDLAPGHARARGHRRDPGHRQPPCAGVAAGAPGRRRGAGAR